MPDERERLGSLTANLRRRSEILRGIRIFFDGLGFLEVETPVRSPAIAPEREIVPIESEGWYLSTSPELYMKRLLAAGYDRIYQLSHCFRKGERGRLHNPEFTLLEWYRASASYEQMMSDTEQLFLQVASRLAAGNILRYQGSRIDLSPPWPRTSVSEAFKKFAGWDPLANPDNGRFDEDLVYKVIPGFDPGRPTFLLDYPFSMASLARLKPGDARLAERVELFIGGLELINAYSELVDPREQESRFRSEISEIKERQGRVAPMPKKFIDALPNLPVCAGTALGVDRMVMLFCDARSIDEVIAFSADEA